MNKNVIAGDHSLEPFGVAQDKLRRRDGNLRKSSIIRRLPRRPAYARLLAMTKRAILQMSNAYQNLEVLKWTKMKWQLWFLRCMVMLI